MVRDNDVDKLYMSVHVLLNLLNELRKRDILEVPVSVTLRALLAKLSNCLETVIFSV